MLQNVPYKSILPFLLGICEEAESLFSSVIRGLRIKYVQMLEMYMPIELTRGRIKPTLDVRMDGEPTGDGRSTAVLERDDARSKRRRQQTPEEILEDEARRGVENLKKRLQISDTKIAPLLLQFAQQYGREMTNEELRRFLEDEVRKGGQEVLKNNMAAAKARWEAQQQQQKQQKEQFTEEDSENAENEPLIFQAGPLKPLMDAVQESLVDGKIPIPAYHNALAQARQMADQEIITEEDYEKFQNRLERYSNGSNAMSKIKQEFLMKEGRRSTVRSIQEVALRIIADEGEDRWGVDGVFPLIDKEDNINQANFLRWVRERMMYYHDQDSTNFELNMFTSVGIQNEFGSKTPILTMVDNRAQFFKDSKTGKTLDELAIQVLNEVWLFGTSRNNDILYQFNMSNDEKLPEFLGRVHLKNEFTKGNHLQLVTSLAENYGEDGDTRVGDAVRRAYEIYYHISDYEKLEEILGKNSPLFIRSAYEDAFRIIERKNKGEAISEEAKKLLDTMFDKNGGIIVGKFIEIMNPFNAQEKDEFHLKISREMMRQVLAHEYKLEYGLDYNMDNKIGETTRRSFLRMPLEYAELWGYTMTRWTGAGSNNDTANIGFDAFTKTMRTRGYRLRQSAATRAGQFGNEYNLGVMKGLTVDLFNAIRVEPTPGQEGPRLTPFEIMTKQSQVDAQIREVLKGRWIKSPELTDEERAQVNALTSEKKRLGDLLRFRQFTQNSYSSNHINRAFTVFHSLMGDKGLKLEEIVKWDPFRGLIYDRGQFEEQVKEGFLKPIRYAFSTYPGIDFGKLTREQIGTEKLPDGSTAPIYKTVTLAEKMFGPEVLSEIKKKAYQVHDRYIKTEEDKKRYLKNGHLTEEGKQFAFSKFVSDEERGGGRPYLWKYAARARIAKELLSHREFGNGYMYFNHMMAEKFILALESIKQVDLVGEDEDAEETIMKYGDQFFTHEDIEWIKNHCKLRRRDILLELGKEASYGLGKGIWEGFEEFFGRVFK